MFMEPFLMLKFRLCLSADRNMAMSNYSVTTKHSDLLSHLRGFTFKNKFAPTLISLYFNRSHLEQNKLRVCEFVG